MLMTRHDAAGPVLGLFAYVLLLVYFHRRTPPSQGGAAMVSVSSALLPNDDQSAVPVEINDDEPPGPVEREGRHRPPKGGAAMASVSSTLPNDDQSAVPVEINDDERTDRLNPEEYCLLVALSESSDWSIPAVINDPPTLRVGATELAHLAEQSQREDRVGPVHLAEPCQLEESDVDAQLLDMQVRARRRTGEAFR